MAFNGHLLTKGVSNLSNLISKCISNQRNRFRSSVANNNVLHCIFITVDIDVC